MQSNILISLVISFIAALGTVVGSLLSFYKYKDKDNFLSLSISLSIGAMTTLSVAELVPEGFLALSSTFDKNSSFIVCIIFVFIGIIILKLIKKCPLLSKEGLYRVGILSFISLILHNLPEGILSFITSYKNINNGIKVSLGVLLHNIPEGIVLALPLSLSGQSKKRVVRYSIICALSEPLGAIIAYLFIRNSINNVIYALIVLIVSGIMIDLCKDDLYKELLIINKPRYSIIGYIIGTILIIISLYII